jgi:hypothetical protein
MDDIKFQASHNPIIVVVLKLMIKIVNGINLSLPLKMLF